MTTTPALLAPYREFMANNVGTVACAMLYAEARHIAEIRNALKTPVDGGWKNNFPLEHATAEGFFFKSCRTCDKSYIRNEAANNSDEMIRMRYAVICNVENVMTTPDQRDSTTDQFVEYAADCLDMPLSNEMTVAGNYVPVVFED